jgi:hypothetical protein
MNKSKRFTENGQAVVLMALMMVGLLASLGLAVDGGGYFFMWRDAMNAADAAAISAAYARCTNGNMETAGLNAARENGFENEGGTAVEVNFPPTLGKAKDDKRYVEVIIEAVKPSYFIQIVYREPLKIKAAAIGICIPPFASTSVPALWAGSTTCQDTVNWTGSTGDITGGVFSNNDFKVTGSGATIGEPVEVVGDIDTGNSGNLGFEPPDYIPDTDSDIRVDPLALTIADFIMPEGDFAIRASEKGKYTFIASNSPLIKNGTWAPDHKDGMIEGMYVVDGNISIGGNTKVGPKGISLVATGEIQITQMPEISPSAVDGRLTFYSDGILAFSTLKSNNPDPKKACGFTSIKLSGNQLRIHGVMYAPNAGVDVSGSQLNMVGKIMAQTIDLSGSELILEDDPDILPSRPPVVQVVE